MKEVLARIDAARAHGVRAAALSRIAAAADRRNAGDHRGSGEKLSVPRDAENAGCVGRFRMSDDLNQCASVKIFSRCCSTANCLSTKKSASNRIWISASSAAWRCERQRELQVALDNIAIEPAPSLLRSCREELHMRLVEEAAVQPAQARLVGAFHGHADGALRVGGLVETGGGADVGRAWIWRGAGAASRLVRGMRGEMRHGGTVRRECATWSRHPDGKVQIVLDETRQRIISGDPDEPEDSRAAALGGARIRRIPACAPRRWIF